MKVVFLLLLLFLVLSCTDSHDEVESEEPQAEGRADQEPVPSPSENAAAESPAAPVADPSREPGKPAPTAGAIATLSFVDKSDGLPPTGPYAGIAMADLDGDGTAELLSGRREDERGLVLFSFKSGRWSSELITERGAYSGVALADLTGDGVPDVLAAKTEGRPNGLELYETKKMAGGLSFSPISSPYPQGCDDLAVGDIDKDGDIDFVVSSRGNRVFLNGGDGRSFKKIELDSDVYEDTGILLADVNADKLLDVLSTNHPGKNTRLFLCQSIKPVRYSARHTTGLPLDRQIGFKIAAADINRDGHIDLAVGTVAGLRIFHGTSCQGPEENWWTKKPLDARSRQTMQPVLADLDRDGDPDLVYTSEEGLHLRLNDGSGQFGERLAGPAIPAQGSYSGCCVADWDGDGDLDIAFSSFQGNGVRLLLNSP